MNTPKNDKPDEDLKVYNYCISFLDLLGQRDALKGQGLLPVFKSDKERMVLLKR